MKVKERNGQKNAMKSPKISDNSYECGSSRAKKTRKPHPVAKIPTSARTSDAKVNALLENRARLAGNVNNVNDIEKNKTIEESFWS